MDYYLAKVRKQASGNLAIAKAHGVWSPPAKLRSMALGCLPGDRILFFDGDGIFCAVATVTAEPKPFSEDWPAPWPEGDEIYPIGIPMKILVQKLFGVKPMFRGNFAREYGLNKVDLESGFRKLEAWQAAELFLQLLGTEQSITL